MTRAQTICSLFLLQDGAIATKPISVVALMHHASYSLPNWVVTATNTNVFKTDLILATSRHYMIFDRKLMKMEVAVVK